MIIIVIVFYNVMDNVTASKSFIGSPSMCVYMYLVITILD